MLGWAIGFFVAALVAAVFGFGGIASAFTGIAIILFWVFLALFVLSLVFNTFGGAHVAGHSGSGRCCEKKDRRCGAVCVHGSINRSAERVGARSTAHGGKAPAMVSGADRAGIRHDKERRSTQRCANGWTKRPTTSSREQSKQLSLPPATRPEPRSGVLFVLLPRERRCIEAPAGHNVLTLS
jgi:uncharacterized membrane protein YtjA (UPF0391 family)